MSELYLFAVPLLFVGMVGLALHLYRVPVHGVYIFLFLSSVTIAPTLPVVGDRLSSSDYVMTLTIFYAFINGKVFCRVNREIYFIDKTADLFILLCVVSSLLAMMFYEDIIRPFVYMVIYVYGYFCFKVIVRLLDSKDKLYKAFLSYGAGAALLTLVGALAATGVYKPAWTYDPIINRISSTMRNSGQVASYLGPALFVFAYVLGIKEFKLRYKYIAAGLLGMAGLVLLATGSRISFVIFIFAMLYVVYVTFRKYRKVTVTRVPIVTLGIVSISIMAFFVITVWVGGEYTYKIGDETTAPQERAVRLFIQNYLEDTTKSADTVEVWGGTRYVEISAAMDVFWENPIFGLGTGMFSVTQRMHEVHNSYFSILVENGILALLIYLWMVFQIFRALFRKMRSYKQKEFEFVYRMIVGSLVVLLIYQMTTNGIRQRPFWFVPALAVVAVSVLRGRSDQDTFKSPQLGV